MFQTHNTLFSACADTPRFLREVPLLMFDHSDENDRADTSPPSQAQLDAEAHDVPPPNPHRPIQDILNRVRQAVDGPSITFGEVIGAMDARSQPVLLLLPALILVSPLSGIPGLSSLGGLTIALVATQILIGRRSIWLPGFLLNRKLPSERLLWAVGKLERPAAFIDRKTVTRAEWVFGFPGRQLLLLICMFCGMIMPFFELIPFSATSLAIVISLMASALLVRDGLIAGLGLGGLAAAGLLIAKLAAT